MVPAVEMRLLDLTRDRQSVTIGELAEYSHVRAEDLLNRIATLHVNGLITLRDNIIELDSNKRVLLADSLIRDGHDPEKISRSFRWQEFEDFAAHSLDENGYRTVKHLVFRSRPGRREIDLLAWNENFILTVDCKHWSKRLSPSRVRNAASAQTERAKLIAEQPETLAKHGLQITERREIMPVIVTLAESRQRVIGGVPVVPILMFPSFLNGVSPVDETLRTVPVQPYSWQSTLV